MAKSIDELIALIDAIPDVPAKPGEYILPELMAIAIANEVRNDDIVFAGTGLPMVGIMTANFTNAPNALLIYEAGICDGKTMHVPMSVCDQRAANMSSSLGGLVDTFGYYLQQGFVTLGFLGGAAIDKYGGVNVTSIGDYYQPQHRFTGSGGNSDIGTMAHRTAFIILQEKRRFLERNEYTTTPGTGAGTGKRANGSRGRKSGRERPSRPAARGRGDQHGDLPLRRQRRNLPGNLPSRCHRREGEGKLRLRPERVQGEGRNPHPTYRELFVLREFVDAELIFLPQKVEYPPDVLKIINS
jgi:glutaconate CoA-transferase subunit B